MSIPIIGHPEIKNVAFALMIKCTCGEHLMLVGNVGAMSPCPSPQCDKVFQLGSPPICAADGSVSAGIGIGSKLSILRAQGRVS